MADNLSISTAGGTITLGTDEVSSVHYQRSKMIFGVDGDNDGDVSQTLPLPVSAAQRTDVMQNGETQLTPKFAYVSLTASGDIVAAVASKQIRVLQLHVEESDQDNDATLTITDGNGGDTLFKATGFDLKDKTLPFSPIGWFDPTTVATALYGVVAGAGPNLNIAIAYVEI